MLIISYCCSNDHPNPFFGCATKLFSTHSGYKAGNTPYPFRVKCCQYPRIPCSAYTLLDIVYSINKNLKNVYQVLNLSVNKRGIILY